METKNLDKTKLGKRLQSMGYTLHGPTTDSLGRSWRYATGPNHGGSNGFFSTKTDLEKWIESVEMVRSFA